MPGTPGDHNTMETRTAAPAEANRRHRQREETGMDVRQWHQANRAAWNEAARRYEQEIEADIALLHAGGKNLMAPELQFL